MAIMIEATEVALSKIEEFTAVTEVATGIRLYLSEFPIGDEYGMLSEQEWKTGEAYVEWLKARGITAFSERPPAR